MPPIGSRVSPAKAKKDSLPHGTFDVYVMDTILFYKIVGWTKGISYSLIGDTLGKFSSGNTI